MSLAFRLFTVAASVVQALGFRDYAVPTQIVLEDATPELDALLRETLASVVAARGDDAAGVRVVELSFAPRGGDADTSTDTVAMMMMFRTDFGGQWRIGKLEKAKLPESVRRELERQSRPDEMPATFLWRP